MELNHCFLFSLTKLKLNTFSYFVAADVGEQRQNIEEH